MCSQFGEVLDVFVVLHEVLKQLLVVGVELQFVGLEKDDPAVVVGGIVDKVRAISTSPFTSEITPENGDVSEIFSSAVQRRTGCRPHRLRFPLEEESAKDVANFAA